MTKTSAFTLVVKALPNQRQAAKTAWRFASALLNNGQTISSVFFYGEGVLTALPYADPAENEWHAQVAWQTLAEQAGFALQVCATAAQRHGLVKDEQPQLAPGFEMASLVDLTQAELAGNKVVYFG
ncbi:sulfurtransferase complex subunit TusD [Salinibius halmophilus]|uniref:sulfurtransferase complex subunit TusD n=1 Tax=Salinibius halmophilus TaxID=1853216 RepID=UPI000E66D34A|nr:sulfurtransferase complex subunit TusD [Salinibius halmophilus]